MLPRLISDNWVVGQSDIAGGAGSLATGRQHTQADCQERNNKGAVPHGQPQIQYNYRSITTDLMKLALGNQ